VTDAGPTMSRKQILAYGNSVGRVNLWEGSIRSGKTFSWLFLLLNAVRTAGRDGAIVIAGKNRDSIYRNVFEPIETIAAFDKFRTAVSYRQGAPTARIYGKMVHVIGANDAGAESKVRGMTIELCAIDELTVVHVNFFKQILGRMSPPGAKLFATTNPDGPMHWLKADYLNRVVGTPHFDPDTPADDVLSNWTIQHFTMDDNPSLTDDYRKSVESEYTGLWYDRFIRGLWVAAEGAIYDMWDHQTMVVKHKDLPPMRRLISLGIDYGTTNPTAGIMIGEGDDDCLYAVAEWAPAKGLTDARLADSLEAWCEIHGHPEWTFIDPSAKSFRIELAQRDWDGLAKAKNDVLDGIRMVASLFARGKLKVSDKCPNLLKEIPGYRWDDKASDKGEDKPIKANDHFCDSLKYGIATSQREWIHLIERPVT